MEMLDLLNRVYIASLHRIFLHQKLCEDFFHRVNRLKSFWLCFFPNSARTLLNKVGIGILLILTQFVFVA